MATDFPLLPLIPEISGINVLSLNKIWTADSRKEGETIFYTVLYCLYNITLLKLEGTNRQTVSVFPCSQGIKSHIVLSSQSHPDIIIWIGVRCLWNAPHLEKDQRSMPPLIFKGIYHDRREKHLSRSHYWLLIRECSKSTCTKEQWSRNGGRRREKSFLYQRL